MFPASNAEWPVGPTLWRLPSWLAARVAFVGVGATMALVLPVAGGIGSRVIMITMITYYP